MKCANHTRLCVKSHILFELTFPPANVARQDKDKRKNNGPLQYLGDLSDKRIGIVGRARD